jgi:uncharacterized RDD family membrane protein YckC
VATLDQVSIDTPEQIALELPLAGIGSRFLAITLDTLLQTAVVVAAIGLLLIVHVTITPLWAGAFFGGLAPAILILFVFCVYWGYFAFFEAVWKGQTPGKRYAGIRVIKESGRPINGFEAIARNLMRAVDGLPGMYGVGILTMVFNRQNRRLGDFVAGTVVVHEQATERVRPFLGATSGADNRSAPAARVEITPEELLLIETYLARRDDLTLDVRDRAAEAIATRILRRTASAKAPGQSYDSFLEALARRTRDEARFR